MDSIFNLTDYTPTEHVLFAIGCVFWVITYIIVIRAIIKKKFVEIPIIAVCSNFAWEALWSWHFKTNMGTAYVWGYRVWFFLDCFIVYGLVRYGMKQLSVEALKKHFYLIVGFSFAACGLLFYYYISIFDKPVTHMGAYSGFVANILMSSIYIPLLVTKGKTGGFSYLAAWCKALGTFFTTLFVVVKFPDLHFLMAMCIVVTILDATYITIFTLNRKKYTKAA